MNDEMKLKDMIDFLENIYKDIKKQPTLEKELEKERKFINKIKGDNKDDIKEMLELHIKHEIDLLPKNQQKVLDYITNLQQENERLSRTITDYDETLGRVENEYEKLREENERLKLEKDTKSASEIICENLHDVYKSRCEKADEFIKENDLTNNKNFMDTGIGNLFKVILKFLEGRSDE